MLRSKRREGPETTYSQVEQRERRLKLLRFDYDGTFALDLEISGLLGPLAAKVATLPKNPLARAGEVAEAHAAAVGVLAWVVTVAGRGAPAAARAVAMMAPRRGRRCGDPRRVVDRWPHVGGPIVGPGAGFCVGFRSEAAGAGPSRRFHV